MNINSTEIEKVEVLLHKKYKRTTNKPTVVLVESNDNFRSYLAVCLLKEYVVEVFGKGTEALKFIKEECVDLVLCNIELCDMSGDELSSRIKTGYDISIIPVIIFSDHMACEQLDKRRASLADTFMCLPLDIEHLKTEMAVLIRNHHALRREFVAKVFGEEFLTTKHDKVQGYDPYELINKVKDFVSLKFTKGEKVRINEVAKSVNMGRGSFYAAWTKVTGEAPENFIHRMKMEKAWELLTNGNYRVVEIPERIGMKDIKNFREAFKEYFNISPSEAIQVGKRKLLEV